MDWVDKSELFKNNKIHSNDVLTCEALDDYFTIFYEDKLDSYMVSADTYNIFADYINDWLCSCLCPSKELADDVLDLLVDLIENKIFTLNDVKNNSRELNKYINEHI